MPLKSESETTVHSAPPSSLVDLLDALLVKGVSVRGDLIVSVAGVELLYVGVGLVASSVSTLCTAAEKSRT